MKLIAHRMTGLIVTGCSSQEEHVLKQVEYQIGFNDYSCSSQEEHVLKPVIKKEEVYAGRTGSI